MAHELSRRQLLSGVAAGTVGALASPAPAQEKSMEPFTYCFNTSTIRGQQISIVDEIQIVAKAGYQAIEPWIRELDAYVKSGGDLRDLGKRIQDAGLRVPSAIGFAEWIVDDENKRKQGLETARRDMDMVRQIGGTRIAAPPVGATNQTDLNLLQAAQRYRELITIGASIGVIPQVEIWGHSKSLNRLGEGALIAIESGHPQACVLADVFHLHKGGSGFEGLSLLGGKALQVFHMNDYPAEPARADIVDAQRVYPGDGVAPLTKMLRDMHAIGFRGAISLELFNPGYWKQDPLQVAQTGLRKMREVVQKSMS